MDCFCADLGAIQACKITRLNRNTLNRYYSIFREKIAQHCEKVSPLKGQIELDESYFGAKRVKGRRGRGALGKIAVFGILKRGDRVFTQIVKNCSKAELMGIIDKCVSRESVVHTDGFKSYDGLVDFGYKKHFRVKHCQDQFATKTSHINGIESFWGFCKTRLSKFRGLSKHKFYLHLKESEFRFNYRKHNLKSVLKGII